MSDGAIQRATNLLGDCFGEDRLAVLSLQVPVGKAQNLETAGITDDPEIQLVPFPVILFSNSAFADAEGKRANEIGSMGPVPKAQCGPSDRTESGLQGQTTSQERASGGSERGYSCNLERVGQFRGEGAFSQDGPSYFDHCAYMATENNPQQAHPGIVVIDVSDPTNPQATAYLADTPAGLNPHESNKVNEQRGLLGLAQSNGPNFAVYDLNGDCAHPRLASSITVPNSRGHMSGWADDGKTYYIGQQFRGVGGILPIVDVTDPYNACQPRSEFALKLAV
jgi:hypothetical protein